MDEKLKILENLAKELNVTHLANFVLKDSRFTEWSGSSKKNLHHYGTGGLITHTCEVVQLCLQNNEYFKGTEKYVDPAKVYLAALFHDAGKMWDYERSNSGFGDWESNDHKYKIHHISRSALVWNEAAGDLEWKDEVLHAILAHHGQREWGSPVKPQTHLAWLLHLCDGISARMDDLGGAH